ncbi:2Fe-2S iron-sulfur cluster-binding protein [Rhizobium oryzicola]|uniref:2Fe-2S iron-sulfur cluster-binding protein n=1 Tax=Rhizobium oryzicola TaxID=1232668 RepID=A0ABT8SYR3_9HYPH|nr:2Fe-2S iron-sulfur cluster-binding protein [Rhizobium oryzicola]MDO1583028.1 2Fe-2S iron-sulfur cluster-binding protein [Rhizobium oryzicola]
MIVYVAMHLTNLAIGLHSLHAMEEARHVLLFPWMSWPGTALLMSAALIHAILGLVTVSLRRSLTLSRTDWVQMCLGLITPPLLLNHVAVAGILHHIDPDFRPDYTFLLSVYWNMAPKSALQQVLVVVVVWIHGSIGLYNWLILKPVWRRIGAFVTPLLFFVPILGLLGFVRGGKEALARLAADGQWQDRMRQSLDMMTAAKPTLELVQSAILLIYGALALVACGVLIWRILERQRMRVTATYETGQTVSARPALSLLEISLLNNVPHANICSGRGRCGTCLVAVMSDASGLTAISETEAQTLKRIHATPGQRLACQARLIKGSVKISRLFPFHVDAAFMRDPHGPGETLSAEQRP